MDSPSPGPSPADAQDFGALAPEQIVGGGRYRLKKILGQGGMSVVWLAHDQRLREPVALKYLPASIAFDPAALDDLRRETYRSRKLSHPHIVRIHDLHEEPGAAPFISMEYVDGPNLHFLRAHRPAKILPWKYLAPLLRQLCQALEYAHAEKIVHRDLKPANLLLDSSERLKLADFGLARVVRDSISRLSGATNPGGTLHFMSPQQADGYKAQVSDDIYSVGASLYDLLTSTPPFYTGDVAYQVRYNRPVDMSERLMEVELTNHIPPAVSELVMACLAKDPQQRPPSATAILQRLDAIEKGIVTVAMPAAAPAPAPSAPIAAPIQPPAPPLDPSPVPEPIPELVPHPVAEPLPPAAEPQAPAAPTGRRWALGIFALFLALGAGGVALHQWVGKKAAAALSPPGQTNAAVAAHQTQVPPPAVESSSAGAGSNLTFIPPSRTPTPPKLGAVPVGRWETRAPLGIGRVRATTVWTGREMIIWGGGTEGKYFNDGFAYDLVANQWRPVATLNAPSARASHAGV
jgi:serine/threonine protein kinase